MRGYYIAFPRASAYIVIIRDFRRWVTSRASGFSRWVQAGAVNPSRGRDGFTFVRTESKGEESRRRDAEATTSGKNGARKCLDICYLPRPLEIINPVKSTKSYLSRRGSCLRGAFRGWRGGQWGREERRRRRRGQRRRPWFRVVETLLPSRTESARIPADIYGAGKYFVRE